MAEGQHNRQLSPLGLATTPRSGSCGGGSGAAGRLVAAEAQLKKLGAELSGALCVTLLPSALASCESVLPAADRAPFVSCHRLVAKPRTSG